MITLGSFICQLCEMDWKVSREIGLYGNREGSERRGNLSFKTMGSKGDQIIQSIIEDLIGMRKGDKVFFHVIHTSENESSLHGIYRVSEVPFYNDSVRVWKSSDTLIYPYRFCFEPHPDHLELCKYDASLLVSEFYRAIENRDVRSVLTLEREAMGAAHAVKTVTIEDAEEIERLMYRDFNSRRIEEAVNFKPIRMKMVPLINSVERVGEIEFAVKSIVAYRLGKKDDSFNQFIPACRSGNYDFLIESFVGQTMRRPTDILCIGERNRDRLVTIIEAKTDVAELFDLVQVLKYKELFKLRNIDRGSISYKISVCLLAQHFKENLVNYTKTRNIVFPSEETILLKYAPTPDGKDAIFTVPVLTEPTTLATRKFPTVESEAISNVPSEPESVYKMFSKRKPLKIQLEFESFEDRNLVLKKCYFNGSAKSTVGIMFIQLLNKKCTLRDFAGFMKRLDNQTAKFQGNFMSVEPIIVAESYEPLVDFFIMQYNAYETLAGKQPITPYAFSEKQPSVPAPP